MTQGSPLATVVVFHVGATAGDAAGGNDLGDHGRARCRLLGADSPPSARALAAAGDSRAPRHRYRESDQGGGAPGCETAAAAPRHALHLPARGECQRGPPGRSGAHRQDRDAGGARAHRVPLRALVRRARPGATRLSRQLRAAEAHHAAAQPAVGSHPDLLSHGASLRQHHERGVPDCAPARARGAPRAGSTHGAGASGRRRAGIHIFGARHGLHRRRGGRRVGRVRRAARASATPTE